MFMWHHFSFFLYDIFSFSLYQQRTVVLGYRPIMFQNIDKAQNFWLTDLMMSGYVHWYVLINMNDRGPKKFVWDSPCVYARRSLAVIHLLWSRNTTICRDLSRVPYACQVVLVSVPSWAWSSAGISRRRVPRRDVKRGQMLEAKVETEARTSRSPWGRGRGRGQI